MQSSSVKKQNCQVWEPILFEVHDEIVTQLLTHIFVFLQVVSYNSGCFRLKNLDHFRSVNLAISLTQE